MEDAEIPTAKQGYNKGWDNIKPWQFKPGQSGNPSGRPKGTVSLKEYAKKYLRELDEEEKEAFLTGLNKHEVWKMAEGNAANSTDLTSGGEKLVVNLITYGGDNNPAQLPTEALSIGVPESTPEVQGGSVAPESGEIQNSPERTDTQNSG